MGDNPKWLKRRVRERMKETGNKYTYTLREILAEIEAAKEEPTDDVQTN